MSLLTTFGILFDTDASEATDDVGRLEDSLDELTGKAKGATDGLDEVAEAAASGSESFSGLARSVGGLIAAYASWQVVAEGVIGNALAIDEVGKFSEVLGLNIQDVDSWGAAVERAGGTSEGFRGSVESLNQSLGDIALTGGGDAALTLARLGISATDSAGRIKGVFQILPELADSFQRLSKQESVAFGQKLGLDQSTILLLQQGRVAVEDLVERQRQLGGMTQEGYEQAALFNDTLDDTKRSFNSLWQAGTVTILPLLTGIFEGLQVGIDWIKQNKTLVTGFFIGVAGVVTAIFFPAMVKAAAATIAATWPFLAIGAAIAAAGVAIALLYEDVVAYIGGQESFIGKLLEKYEWLGKAVDFMVESVKLHFEVLSKLFEWLIKLFTDPQAALESLGNTIDGVFDGVVSSVSDAVKTVETLMADMLGFLADPQEALEGLGEKINDTFSGVVDFFGFGDDEITANTNRAIEVSQQYNANPLNNGSVMSQSRIINRQQTVNVGGATINASGMSTSEAQQVVGESMRGQIAMAAGQLDDGVDY